MGVEFVPPDWVNEPVPEYPTYWYRRVQLAAAQAVGPVGARVVAQMSE